VTIPGAGTFPFFGPEKGKFIETVLKDCFNAMNAMPQGGDDYFAAQFASAVDAYLKAGTTSGKGSLA
jgi:hypothetical protein